jgi:hypothetical protein
MENNHTIIIIIFFNSIILRRRLYVIPEFITNMTGYLAVVTDRMYIITKLPQTCITLHRQNFSFFAKDVNITTHSSWNPNQLITDLELNFILVTKQKICNEWNLIPFL